jgi:hypothetical protein
LVDATHASFSLQIIFLITIKRNEGFEMLYEQPDLVGEIYDESPRDMMSQINIEESRVVAATKLGFYRDVINKRNLSYNVALDKFGKSILALGEQYPDAMGYWQLLIDGNALSTVWAVVLEAQNTKKYTQWSSLYMDYEPKLRTIIAHNNEQSESALDLLNELYLLQTNPGLVKDFGIDSYTGEVYEAEPYVKIADVPTSEPIEEMVDVDCVAEEDFLASIEEHVLEDEPVVATESAEVLSAKYSGSFSGDLWDEDHDQIVDEDAETTSASINQSNTAMMRPTEMYYELRGTLAPLFKAVNNLRNQLFKEHSDKDSIYREVLTSEDIHPVDYVYRDLPDDVLPHNTSNTFTTHQYKLELQNPDDSVNLRVTRDLLKSDELVEFLFQLEYQARYNEPQDIYCLWLDLNIPQCGNDIPLSNGMYLDKFASLHGDFIEDEYRTNLGDKWQGGFWQERHDEPVIDGDIDGRPINKFTDGTMELLLSQCDDESPKTSKAFAKAMVEAVENGKSVQAAIANAWDGWRMSKSPTGQAAYVKSRAENGDDKQAMIAFYDAAHASGEIIRPRDRVVKVQDNKIVILTARSGFKTERTIDVAIAKLKAKGNEMYVPKDADSKFKQTLFSLLSQWPMQLLASMKE